MALLEESSTTHYIPSFEEFRRVVLLDFDLQLALSRDWDEKYRLLLVVYLHKGERYLRDGNITPFFIKLRIPIRYSEIYVWDADDVEVNSNSTFVDSSYSQYTAFIKSHIKWIL